MAVRLAEEAGLGNAATAEFLLDRDGAFWFLEVNTRLQVEHPVTELVSGIDIVHEQFRIAAGQPLSRRVLPPPNGRPGPRSHAIELRISRREPGRGSSLRHPARSHAGDARRARASASTRPSRPATASRRSTTRSSRS